MVDQAVSTCMATISNLLAEVLDHLNRNEKAKARMVAKELREEATALQSLLEEPQ